MTIRILEDISILGLKRNEIKNFDNASAKALISSGYAVAVKETTTDKIAEDVLLSAKERDSFNK